ncbi:MAG: PIN domain-containing protein [Candidatus Dormibacteraeota bacterium]|nr:PIN domain-containing protein [Candidatus Dormibacteraeota bacterium]
MAARQLTADSSVIIPSLVLWHPLHSAAADAVKGVRRLPAHALLESFAVLTRLPAPRAIPPRVAERLLAHSFPDQPLALAPAGYQALVHKLAEADLGGGLTYDAIIGATAAENGSRLLTADRRAVPIYALMGAAFELVS